MWIAPSKISHEASTPHCAEWADTGKVLRKLFADRLSSRTENFSDQICLQSQVNLFVHIVRVVYHELLPRQALHLLTLDGIIADGKLALDRERPDRANNVY